MQFLILSDIHANWHALESVLADAKGQFQEIICCGDLVGYNAQPGRVVEWVKANCDLTIRGNHDKVVAGLEDLEWFNEIARTAARWTIGRLSKSQISFLHELREGPARNEYFHIWHGSPSNEDRYVMNSHEAKPVFAHFELPLAFFGHTHLQGGFFSKYGHIAPIHQASRTERGRTIELEPDTLYLINPGAVGQPRDGDPRAAYAIFDSARGLVTFRRAEYNVEKAAAEIEEAGLPDTLGLRLFHGL